MKNIVFFDIDNTVLNGYSQKYLIIYLFKNKYIGFNTVLIAYFWFLLYRLNIISNSKSALRYFAKSFNGWTDEKMDAVMLNFFNNFIKNLIFPESIIIIEKHIQNGDDVIFLSSVIDPIARSFANFFGIKNYLSSSLEFKNGFYTGNYKHLVIDGDDKLKSVKIFLSKIKYNFNTFFYSDHHSDLPVLEYVNFPVVINPDNILYAKAIAKKWKIFNFKIK